MNVGGPEARVDAVDSPMTPQEARAIVGMWSLEQRLNGNADLNPTVKDLSEGLSISLEEVGAYLARVRASSATAIPEHSKRRDIWLAGAVVALMAMIAVTAFLFLGVRRSAAPVPIAEEWIAPPALAPMPAILETPLPPFETAAPVAGDRFVLRDELGRRAIDLPSEISAANLRQQLSMFTGGPLGARSAVWSRTLSVSEVDRLLSGDSRLGSYSVLGGRRVLEWKTFRVALREREVQAELPFALVTQKEVRTAVEAAQSKILDEMVESAFQIAK